MTLNLSEAAALLKVDTETMRRLAANGTVSGARIGRAWVFLQDDLLDYLRQQIREQTNRRRPVATRIQRGYRCPPVLP